VREILGLMEPQSKDHATSLSPDINATSNLAPGRSSTRLHPLIARVARSIYVLFRGSSPAGTLAETKTFNTCGHGHDTTRHDTTRHDTTRDVTTIVGLMLFLSKLSAVFRRRRMGRAESCSLIITIYGRDTAALAPLGMW
jgi:hypothetical protein